MKKHFTYFLLIILICNYFSCKQKNVSVKEIKQDSIVKPDSIVQLKQNTTIGKIKLVTRNGKITSELDNSDTLNQSKQQEKGLVVSNIYTRLTDNFNSIIYFDLKNHYDKKIKRVIIEVKMDALGANKFNISVNLNPGEKAQYHILINEDSSNKSTHGEFWIRDILCSDGTRPEGDEVWINYVLNSNHF